MCANDLLFLSAALFTICRWVSCTQPSCEWSPWSNSARCEWTTYNRCSQAFVRMCTSFPSSDCYCNRSALLKELSPRRICSFWCPRMSTWGSWSRWNINEDKSYCSRSRKCLTGSGRTVSNVGCLHKRAPSYQNKTNSSHQCNKDGQLLAQSLPFVFIFIGVVGIIITFRIIRVVQKSCSNQCSNCREQNPNYAKLITCLQRGFQAIFKSRTNQSQTSTTQTATSSTNNPTSSSGQTAIATIRVTVRDRRQQQTASTSYDEPPPDYETAVRIVAAAAANQIPPPPSYSEAMAVEGHSNKAFQTEQSE